MAMTLNTNLASLNAQTNLNTSQSSMTTSLQRLSSGLRINSAKDDAAGLSISERMTSQIRGLDQAARNASDAISLTQTAEGNLSQISSVLQRMREIAVQSASDSNTATDRTSLQSEAASLSSEIDRIANTAQFNGKNLLDGTFGSATFQVGANAGQTLAVSINGSTTTTLGLSGIATSTGTVSGTAALTNAGNMTISTGTVTTIAASTDDGASYVAGARAGTTSALALANAINAKTADTSIAATAKTEVTSAAVSTTSAVSSGDLYINGTSIGSIAASASVADRVTALVSAINGVSGTTGVTAASATSSTYKLTAADGRNIDVTSNLTGGAAAYGGSGFSAAGATGGVGGGASAVTNYGQVTMTSGKAITVAGTAVNGLASSALVGTTLSILTQVNASTAITSLDTAINTVNTQRSTMGIAQTRLDSVIANLHTSSDNVGAARGRIRDTDFAKETASMTRNQVLQQAGVAMLAQANALPNLVLSLLK